MKSSILACDVFEDELKGLGADPASIRWLEMGLHDRPDNLRAEITQTLAEIESNPEVEIILLAYGMCGRGLIGVQAQRCPLLIPQAHDCVSILMGKKERHEALVKEHPATYFYSPGWIRGRRVPGPGREAQMREEYAKRYPDDEEMVEDLLEADRDSFAHHDTAAYIDITDNAEAESYCRNCAAQLGWEFRKLEGDCSLLEALLDSRVEDERLLFVPPGHRIGLDSEGHLIAERA
jgi:hypothetical protein